MHRQMSRRFELPLLAFGLTVLIACGGENTAPRTTNGSGIVPPIVVTVTSIAVLPTAANLTPGVTRLFVATVVGGGAKTARWSVQEGATGGSIANTGLYTAPGTPGTFHVIATSVDDSTKSASAAVTVYDFTGSYATPRAMQNVRGIHTATLLSSGILLVAGGSNGWTEDWDEAGQKDAELYNPVNGDFDVTVDMTSNRTRGTATLLPNGKVLLTGGEGEAFDQPPVLSSAELYDPGTGRFAAIASMADRPHGTHCDTAAEWKGVDCRRRR